MGIWSEETDLIVLGSGIAGLSAAIEAGLSGASVIVFEKMKIPGGNSRISDGGLAAPNNYLQKTMGVADSPELFFKDMMKAGSGINYPHLVKIAADKAAEAVLFIRNDLGVKFQERLDRFGGHSVERCLTTINHSGSDIIKAQISKLKQLGIDIRTRHKMINFIVDKNGGVEGVEIASQYNARDESCKKIDRIRARRGVVLATGGFANDLQFRMLQNPFLNKSVKSTNHQGATAEGLLAALKINALPVHLSHIQMGPWGCEDESGYGKGARFASYCTYPFGILVDPFNGQRVVNEWGNRKERSDAILNTGHPCIGIVDLKGVKESEINLGNSLNQKKIIEFENLAELAGFYGIPFSPLEKTVKNYNSLIKKEKKDQFGKKLDHRAFPLKHPPFYGIRLWPKVHYTAGGIGINSNAQVINYYNQPIPNLYAAGEVCGGIHGASRLGSCALTECIVFGRIAGQQVAQNYSI